MNDINEIEKLKREIISLKETIEDLEAQVDSLQSDNEDLEEKIGELQAMRTVWVSEIDDLFDWQNLTHVERERVKDFAHAFRYEVKA